MSIRWGELVATDKPAVFFKSCLNTTVVEDGESDGCFAHPPWADQSDWGEAFCEMDDPPD